MTNNIYQKIGFPLLKEREEICKGIQEQIERNKESLYKFKIGKAIKNTKTYSDLDYIGEKLDEIRDEGYLWYVAYQLKASRKMRELNL